MSSPRLAVFYFAALCCFAAFAFAADETPPAPSIADGCEVAWISLPPDGSLEKAVVDFTLPGGEFATAQMGKEIGRGLALDAVAWSEDGERLKITLRKGDERGELWAAGEIISQRGARAAVKPQVEIEAYFYEVPALRLRSLRRALDAVAGEDHTALAMLDRGLDGGAPAQVLTPPQFAVLTAFLANNHDVDTVAVPRVTTKSGQRAVIEIIREFRYPTEWRNDPTMPKPVTPVAFETRNCGVTLEVEPVLKKGSLVTLALTPQVVEFLGAVGIDKSTPFLRKHPAKHLPERANGNIEAPPLHGRPARFVFSARIAREHLDLLSGYGALLTDLRESEDLGPLKSAAPKGRLIVLIKSSVLNPPRE